METVLLMTCASISLTSLCGSMPFGRMQHRQIWPHRLYSWPFGLGGAGGGAYWDPGIWVPWFIFDVRDMTCWSPDARHLYYFTYLLWVLEMLFSFKLMLVFKQSLWPLRLFLVQHFNKHSIKNICPVDNVICLLNSWIAVKSVLAPYWLQPTAPYPRYIQKLYIYIYIYIYM